MYLWTAECVGAGHPDKLADQISDSVLDACLEQDPLSRVACEVLVKNDTVVLAGEITTTAVFDYQLVVLNTLDTVGYEYQPTVINLLTKQSREISDAVESGRKQSDIGAGDQGFMFGYACNDTNVKMPLCSWLSRWLVNELTEVRTNKTDFGFLPDCKTQVTVAYDSDDRPHHVRTVVVSTNHKPTNQFETIKYELKSILKEKAKQLPGELSNLFTSKTIWLINPAGEWTLGGPFADCGLVGRKLVIDSYGPDCPIGGGSYSSKDSTKVDRSGAYMARYIAKNIVAADLAGIPNVTVQLAYVIGQAQPVSFRLKSTDNDVNLSSLTDKIKGLVDMRPGAIIERFGLRKPIFFVTANKGHFGIEPYEVNGTRFYGWEDTTNLAKLL